MEQLIKSTKNADIKHTIGIILFLGIVLLGINTKRAYCCNIVRLAEVTLARRWVEQVLYFLHLYLKDTPFRRFKYSFDKKSLTLFVKQ